MKRETLNQLLEDYSRYHRTRGNRLCHAVGIPMIALGSMGLLTRVHFAGGILLWLLFSGWTFWLAGIQACGFVFITFAICLVSRWFPAPLLWFSFISGWALQFVGHKYFERNSPAFLDNLKHLAVGPLWILSQGIKK